MSRASVRGRIAPEHHIDDVATACGWTPVATDSIVMDWPSADRLTKHLAWRSDKTTLAVVEDSFILRTYLWSAGQDGSEKLHELARDGVLVDPQSLLEAAREGAAWWAELGDTLYDLVGGCIDSDGDEVFGIWRQRLDDQHPLIRLAASWVGPYLVGDRVAAVLEEVAEADEDARVREAAATSAAFLRQRVDDSEDS
jgi:hypothetical protein